MTLAISQASIEMENVLVQDMKVATDPTDNVRTVHSANMSQRARGLALKQPMLNRKATDRYYELVSFEVEVKNKPMTKHWFRW